ncbi:MAG: GAF domain-containing SpoIIE family protein phosphatase [Gemmatimonadota bacterium]
MPEWRSPLLAVAGVSDTPDGPVWLTKVPGADSIWLEFGGVPNPAEVGQRLLPVAGALVAAEYHAIQVSEELANRLEEIDLLYAISDTLGRTLRLEEAAQKIVRDVSDVVGASRASIMVYDEEADALRTVAARGFNTDQLLPVDADDDSSVAAQVFRESRVIAYDPAQVEEMIALAPERGYRGGAFVSIPICYSAPGLPSRCIGVINLTDRLGTDSFTDRDIKLLTAIANQVGAAIENARLAARDLKQQGLRQELQLAHDLQLRLLPSPSVLQGAAHVAALCRPADSVGGDFYTFSKLGGGRVGVMVGDVSSHGFSAALVMALVLSAAGIHAASSLTPDETLTALLESLATELASTEMYLSVFYGVLDPDGTHLVYASAGHPHAFRIPRAGVPVRLETTAPPLGLAAAGSIDRLDLPWDGSNDLLCVWTDGLVESRNPDGVPFGEARLLEALVSRRELKVDDIVEGVFQEADEWCGEPTDDRTLLVLRM